MNGIERLYAPPEIGAPGKRNARKRRRDLTLTGLFVLGMGALAVAALVILIPGLLGDSYRVRVYFADASGLLTGTQVIQDGYLIGVVEQMTPIFPGRDEGATHCPPAPGEERSSKLPCFRATLRIRDNWPIPEDSAALLGSAGLLQGEAIKIQPGASEALLQEGQTIVSAARETDLVAELEKLTASLRDMVHKTIEPTLAHIRDQIETFKDLLGTSGENTENKDRLAGVFQNLQNLSADIESAVDPKQIQAILSSVQQLSVNLVSLSATLAERSGEIERTVKGYGDLATDIRGMVKESKPPLQRSLDDVQFLLQELSATLVPILTNVEDATRNLSALSRDLRNNPAVIIKGREVENQTPWFE